MSQKVEQNWIDLKGITAGWNSNDDPTIIADTEIAEAKNIVFDNGFLSPREGSSLEIEKPSGEAGDPLQLIIAKTSDGVEFFIAVYANHFYVYHDTNEEWIRINTTFVPTETTLRYGWVNWNNGRGDDRLYFCNGVDSVGRWDMVTASVSGNQSAGATTLLLDDATRFPASGTIVIKGSSGEFIEAYTSKTNNTLNLTNTLNEAVSNEMSVSIEVAEKSGMEVGKILVKHQSRLIIANYYGGEIVYNASVQEDPENFTVADTIAGAYVQDLPDGNGEITASVSFGKFLLMCKEDSLHSLTQEVSEDLVAKLIVRDPILTGESIGPISQDSIVRIGNALYYPTNSNGFVYLYPTATGNAQSASYKAISSKINNYVTKSVNYNNCRSAVFDNKAIWAVALDDATENTILLIYDTIRNAWSRAENLSVQDFGMKGNLLYYLGTDGNLYQLFNGNYYDTEGETNNPYLVDVLLKRFDFGKLSQPKTEDLIYIQGYLTPATEFFVDVLFNEGGILDQQSFTININTPRLIVSEPLTDALGQLLPGALPMGWVILSEIGNLSFFRCYLGIKKGNGFFNLQLRIRSNKEAFWGITGIGFNPELSPVTPNYMVIDEV